MGGTVGLGAATLLALMLLMTSLQQRSERRATQLDGSLGIVREELRMLSMTDALTGLPNRMVFQDRLKQAMARSDRDGRSIAVMFVDIDDFKAVDHSWSDGRGEDLVRQVAARLTQAVRGANTVAAVGGDQLLVMMDGLLNLEPAVRVAESMRRAVPSNGVNPPAALSIGFAVYPSDGALGSLVGHASAASEAAARAGGDCDRFFESKMDSDAVEKAQCLEHLRAATTRGEMQLHCQPRFDASTGDMAGAQALLRRTHPTLGSVSPAVFIPLAEKFGLIEQLGSGVIEESCRQMRSGTGLGIDVPVAINVSVFQLRTPGRADQIISTLARHGVDPGLQTCEITESGAMDNAEESLAVFQKLQAAGIQISIDDSGTGYSSLSDLRRLPYIN
jgi:diguanylate cyclase (GGDEF)-like protein